LVGVVVSWRNDVSIEHLMQAWKDWFDTEAPEDMTIPDNYSTTLSTFHKLLLIRSWCPDRTIPMAKVYVAEVMGKQVLFICQHYDNILLYVIIVSGYCILHSMPPINILHLIVKQV